jgi:dipeptidyl aminopeptidase/acylaminoacyl peptidase
VIRHIACALVLLPVAAGPVRAGAEDAGDRYRMPPAVLARIVDAPVTPAVLTSPSGRTLLVGEQSGLLSIADLSQPELKLAGLRFNPINRAPGRATYLKALTLLDVATRAERPLEGLPAGAHMRSPSWSPDERHVAFTHATTGELQLGVADVGAARARRLAGIRINNARAASFRWMPDAKALVCATVPEGQAAPPAADDVPTGPGVQESTPGQKAPVRTYQDLLKTPHDEKLFEHYVTAELVLVPLAGGEPKKLTGPELVTSYEPSPDGRYLLLETFHAPFSHIVPAPYFALKSEVRTIDGARVTTVADLPPAENIPPDRDAVRQGRRDIDWRPDAPATLFWAEAQDEGDPKKEVPVHDKVFLLAAPFTAAPAELVALPLRFAGIDWGSDDLALATESWWKTRKTRTYRVAPGKPGGKPAVVFDRSSEDRYSDPGDPATRFLPTGHAVMLTADGGRTLFLLGQGASPEGDRPFVDRFDLARRSAKRLWRSEAPFFERPLRVLDDAGNALLTLRESVTEPRNLFRRELARGALDPITRIPHPAPALRDVKKELIHYKRADGIALTGMLYLPPGFTPKKDAPLPALLWAYPAEFKSASAAGQVQDSPYRFVSPSPHGPVMFALQGYAVLDDPTFPIVGEGKTEPNDSYVKQLTMGAQAAVDELARRGAGDPARLAIGGHSYGAFTTANLLAHSDLFRAGIARSGAYNRTLTPFGFQAEERTFWEARDTYVTMSPFTVADKIDEPLLMIHGAEDSNPGTFPIQSERLLHAIKGLGGTARLVMLPKESHGYQARESLMHMVWEMDAWLERHVKGAGPRRPR